MVPRVSDACVIGVDVGGTKLLAGAVDGDLAVHHRAQRSSQDLTTTELLDVLAEMVQEAAAAAPQAPIGVGFGVPGALDRRHGIVAACPHLPLEGVRFQALMEERLGMPVAIENDANCAMLAEWRHGAAMGCDDAVLLTVGTGVGGGIVVGRRLVTGDDGVPPELGAMVLDDGPAGRRTLEDFASAGGFAAAYRRAGGDTALSPIDIFAQAAAGQGVAIATIDAIARRIAQGLGTLVNALNLEACLVGGGIAEAGEPLLQRIRAQLPQFTWPFLLARVRVARAETGQDAGMLGAALTALRRHQASGAAASGRPAAAGPVPERTQRRAEFSASARIKGKRHRWAGYRRCVEGGLLQTKCGGKF